MSEICRGARAEGAGDECTGVFLETSACLGLLRPHLGGRPRRHEANGAGSRDRGFT